MNSDNKSLKEWQKYHYEVEKDYAKRILLTQKNSDERAALFKEAYNQLANIIEKYNPGGSEPAHNPRHTKMVVSIVKGLAGRSGSVFDIGCATGNLIKELAVTGYQVGGIEVSDTFIEIAKTKLRSISCEDSAEQADITHYHTNDTYDFIVMDNVLEHIVPDSVNDVLTKCYRMLNKKGYLLIIVPHKFSGPHDISHFFLPLGSKADGLHFWEFTFTELDEVLREAGFQKVLGFPFYPSLRRFRRFYEKFNMQPSMLAAYKAKLFEKLFSIKYLSKVLIIDLSITEQLVGILFPGICVGVKEI